MGMQVNQSRRDHQTGGILHRAALQPLPGHTPQPTARLTLRSANGVKLRLLRR